MPFKSSQPDIKLPTDISIWDWLFNSPSSVLNNHPASALGGYSNALTGERLDYAKVAEVTTYLSTALVKEYGLKQGGTVALFSPNNIYYPVAMVRYVYWYTWKAVLADYIYSVARDSESWYARRCSIVGLG